MRESTDGMRGDGARASGNAAYASTDSADDTPMKAWARALALTADLHRTPTPTLPARLRELATAFGDNDALVGESETLSYRELDRRVNRYARWAREQGLRRGDVVAL